MTITRKMLPIPCPGEDLEELVSSLATLRNKYPGLSVKGFERIWKNNVPDYNKKLFEMLRLFGESAEEIREVLGEHVLDCVDCSERYVNGVIRKQVEYVIEDNDLKNTFFLWLNEPASLSERIRRYYRIIETVDERLLSILQKKPADYHA